MPRAYETISQAKTQSRLLQLSLHSSLYICTQGDSALKSMQMYIRFLLYMTEEREEEEEGVIPLSRKEVLLLIEKTHSPQ